MYACCCVVSPVLRRATLRISHRAFQLLVAHVCESTVHQCGLPRPGPRGQGLDRGGAEAGGHAGGPVFVATIHIQDPRPLPAVLPLLLAPVPRGEASHLTIGYYILLIVFFVAAWCEHVCQFIRVSELHNVSRNSSVAFIVFIASAGGPLSHIAAAVLRSRHLANQSMHGTD